MSNKLEQLADIGDAAITRWSEEHLPQSDIARARRKRTVQVLGAVTAGALGVAGSAVITEGIISAADHQAQHVQEQNGEWAQKAQESEHQFAHNHITLDVPESSESK